MQVQRVPLIPGHTDGDENLEDICRFAARLGLQHIAFLPFNPATGAKYAWLEQECGVDSLVQQSPERLEAIRQLGESFGLVGQIGG